jgi:hypothetical protein
VRSQTVLGDNYTNNRASDRGRIGVFYAFKMPKTYIDDDVGDLKYVFTKPKKLCKNIIMQEYDSKCLKMYLITLLKCLRQSPKSMNGSQIHLALAHWK